jgi:hypothetical protein
MEKLLQVCLALFCLISSVSAESEVFRLFFRYGFGKGTVEDPASQPSEEDIKGLLCATNDFFTDSMQNHTKSSSVEIHAVEIDWGFEDFMYIGGEPEAQAPGKNVPVIVNWTARVTTTDGSTSPSNDDLWEATKYFDYFSYIQDYLWKIGGDNFFTSTRGLWYEPLILPPVTGKMADNSNCPAPAARK